VAVPSRLRQVVRKLENEANRPEQVMEVAPRMHDWKIGG
jgi:hypothetical protein